MSLTAFATPIKTTPNISQQEFEASIANEFIKGSSINPALFEAAIEFHSDFEFDHLGEPFTPIHNGLNWKYSPWRHQANRAFYAAFLLNEDGSIWQAKLSTPILDQKSAKYRKYEAPKGNGARGFLPHVPPEIRQRIADRYGVEVPMEGSFWNWLYYHPEIPLFLTEGGKKGLCLLSLGYVAIALYGVDAGTCKGGNGVQSLIDDLQPYCVSGRTIVLAFDQDQKPETRQRVAKAKSRLAYFLRKAGCAVLTAEWEPSEGKGIDDLCTNQGAERVEQIIDQVQPLTWKSHAGQGFDYSSNHKVAELRALKFRQIWNNGLLCDFLLQKTLKAFPTTQYEGYAPILNLNHASTIALQGNWGSGKTETEIRSLPKDRQIILIVSRNAQGKQAESRFRSAGFDVYFFQDDVSHYGDLIRTGHCGVFILCVDSLSDHHFKNFRVQKSIVVIDEFCSIRREIVRKPKQFQNYERVLRESEQLIVADANISDFDVLLLSRYRGNSIHIYTQRFCKSKKQIIWLEGLKKDGELAFNHDGIILPIFHEIHNSGARRFVVVVDRKSTAKAVALECRNLGIKYALACSDTPEESRKLASDPDSYLKQTEAKVLIYTSTLESAVDIQLDDFDCGLAISTGVIHPLAFLQMMGRPRRCNKWYVAAAAQSSETNISSCYTSREKIAALATQVGSISEQINIPKNIEAQEWEAWEEAQGQVAKKHCREYLRQLLELYFEDVTEQTIDSVATQEFRLLQTQIKREDARLTITADLERGRDLHNRQQAPAVDSDVWAVRLATALDKYPILETAVQKYQACEDPDEKGEVFQIFTLFLNNRLEHLKNWVIANDPRGIDVQSMRESLGERFTTYNGRLFRTFRNVSLFRELNLKSLAKRRRKTSRAIHETDYCNISPITKELWEKFQQSEAREWFPPVTNPKECWAVITRCMTAMGYKDAGGERKIRIQTEEVHPNGRDRNGKQRFSQSKVCHFVGWLIMEESGSALFRELFPVIITAIEERLDRERQHWQQWRESEQSRGSPEWAAA